jgi:exosortase A
MATPQDEVALQDREQSIIARWKMRLLVGSCLAAVLGVYWPTTAALSELWLDTDKTTFTHGFIVLAIAFWLILRDERLEVVGSGRPSLLGTLVYLVCSIGWLVAYRASIETAHELALPVLAVSAVYALFGFRTARLAAFPICFLVFAIPIWDVLTPYLQTVSAAMVGHMLHLTGISAYVEGSLVHIGVGTFEIAGGCSGLHFVMVGLALGALYGELGRDSFRTRAVMFALSFFLALAANWLRVYVIVIAGHLTNMQSSLVHQHYGFGWCVFAGMMLVFFWIGSRIPSQTELTADKADLPIAPPVQTSYIALVLLLVPIWILVEPSHLSPVPREGEMRPKNLPTWSGPLQADEVQWHPVFVGADAESLSAYDGHGSDRVYLYIAAYRKQKQDSELVGYHNQLFGDADNVEDSQAISKSTHEYVLEHAGSRDLLRFSYRIGGLSTGNGFIAQLAYGVKSLWSAPLSRIVAIRTACASDCESAKRRLDAFETALRAEAAH